MSRFAFVDAASTSRARKLLTANAAKYYEPNVKIYQVIKEIKIDIRLENDWKKNRLCSSFSFKLYKNLYSFLNEG